MENTTNEGEWRKQGSDHASVFAVKVE